MQVVIHPLSNETSIIYFDKKQSTLNVFPFSEKIEGLEIHLIKKQTGEKKTVSLACFDQFQAIDVNGYDWAWFSCLQLKGEQTIECSF